MCKMDDIEQQCEDAVFEVCDARERYPMLCAEELARCIRLENEISMTTVKCPTPAELKTVALTEEQRVLLDSMRIVSSENSDRTRRLKILSNRLTDLKIAAEQISNEKYCEINRLLKR